MRLTTAALSTDSDAFRIATKGSDVSFSPLDSQPLIPQAGVGRALCLERVALSKAEDTQSVVDLNNHDRIAVLRRLLYQTRGLRDQLILRAFVEASAMDEQKNGQLVLLLRPNRPVDVEMQAILRDPVVARHVQRETDGILGLRTHRTSGRCVYACAFGWDVWLRRFEAIRAAGVLAVRDAEEVFDLILDYAGVGHVAGLVVGFCFLWFGGRYRGVNAEGEEERLDKHPSHREAVVAPVGDLMPASRS